MARVFILLLLTALSNSAVVNQTCTAGGKFVADYNCTSYSVCLDSYNGTFTSYNIMCPEGFIVRHSDMVCSKAGDVCNPNYNCTKIGNYTDPSSVNALSYISCIQGLGDMIIATVMDCPLNYTFNDTLRVCEQNFVPITSIILNVATQTIPIEVSTQTTPSATTQIEPNDSSSTRIIPIANTTQKVPTTSISGTISTEKIFYYSPVTVTPRLSNRAAHSNYEYFSIFSFLLSLYVYSI